MKKIVAALLSMLLFCGLILGTSALEAPDASHCAAAILYNVENDRILFSKEADRPLAPASTVKLMTALVAYENLKDRLDETVTITSPMINTVTGNYIGLKRDEKITVNSLFYALLLRGANDAAHALAILSCGSLTDFVSAMNARAAELGMTATTYQNVSGMDSEGMTTTAADTLLAARAFYACEYLMEVSSTVKYVVPKTNLSDSRNLYNRNHLVSKYSDTRYFYAYARGMNVGSTSAAGNCCVSSAAKNGLSYLCVVMGGEEVGDENFALTHAGSLLRYGIENFGYHDLIDAGRAVCELPVTLSDKADHVILVPQGNLSAYTANDIDLKKDVALSYRTEKESLQAPVNEGEILGSLNVFIGEEYIGQVSLVAKNSVERSSLLYAFSRIEAVTSSRLFRGTLVAAVLITLGYILIRAYVGGRKKKRRGRYHL